MTLGTNLIAANLSLSLETIIVLLLTLGSGMFAAKSLKLAITSLFAIMASLFIAFYQFDMNWIPPLIIMLLAFVIMVLLFIPISNTSSTGGLT